MTQAEFAYKMSIAEANERDDLVMSEISQVYYIATRIRERLPRQVDLEDLVSAGVVGLLEAARSFDSSKNAQFRTFAKFRIRGAIIDSLREMDWGSRSMRKRGREIAEATSQLQCKLGRQPSEAEIAEELGLKTERLHRLNAEIDSLQIAGQRAVLSDDRSEVVDLIESAPNLTDPDPLEICLDGEKKAHLAEAISRLSEREQAILSLYYREELTIKETAEVVGVSPSRISQILKSITDNLRVTLEELGTTPTSRTTQIGGQLEYT